jgi:hypothetical protein
MGHPIKRALLAALLFASVPAWCGIAFVGSSPALGSNCTTSTGTSISVTYSPTAGNYVFVALSVASTISAVTVKDSAGNTLTAAGAVSNTVVIELFFEKVPASITSFTATWTTARISCLSIEEISGVGSVTAITGTTGTSTAPSITDSSSAYGDWLVAAAGNSSSTAMTASVGNLRTTETITSAIQVAEGDYLSVSSSITISFTSLNTKWAMAGLRLTSACQPALTLLGVGPCG